MFGKSPALTFLMDSKNTLHRHLKMILSFPLFQKCMLEKCRLHVLCFHRPPFRSCVCYQVSVYVTLFPASYTKHDNVTYIISYLRSNSCVVIIFLFLWLSFSKNLPGATREATVLIVLVAQIWDDNNLPVYHLVRWCDAMVIFSEMLTIDTPQLAREGEILVCFVKLNPDYVPLHSLQCWCNAMVYWAVL